MENKKPFQAWRATLVAFALSWSFVPLAFLFNAAGWGRGARAYLPHAGIELVLKGLFIYCGSFFFFIFPTAYLLYGDNTENLRGLPRVLLVTFLLALPVFSFAYSMGNFKESLAYTETAVSLGTLLFTQVLIYEATRNTFCFSVGMALGIFMPLFVVNELLGPFYVYLAYAPQSMTLYWLHRAGCAAAVVVCLWQTRTVWAKLFRVHAHRHVERT